MIPTVGQFISGVVNNFTVRPTNGANVIGVGGFVFDIRDTEEVAMDSEITDHYTEDNNAIQDHIALRPTMFTLRGYIGELRDLQSQSLFPLLTKVQSLASIGGFMNKFSAQATQAYAKITDVTSKIDSAINQANNVFDMFNGKSTTENNQQKAFLFFQQLWSTRQLCQVETPFQVFNDMAIVSIRSSQKGDTNIMSDFSVTFKQIRTAATRTIAPQRLSGRAWQATQPTSLLGQVPGKQVSVDILSVTYKSPFGISNPVGL